MYDVNLVYWYCLHVLSSFKAEHKLHSHVLHTVCCKLWLQYFCSLMYVCALIFCNSLFFAAPASGYYSRAVRRVRMRHHVLHWFGAF